MDINKYSRNCIGVNILECINKDTTGRFKQHAYAKHDGSLKNRGAEGIEIVFHPMTYGYIKNNMYIFDQLFEYKNSGCYSYESKNCGFHVHMSKDAFGRMHLYKFLKMIYENKLIILKLAERKNEENDAGNNIVDAFCFFDIEKRGMSIKEMSIKRKQDTKTRHSAVNISNEKTVELRFFKGTLEKKRFIKNLQLCLSLYDFTKVTPIKDISKTNYLKYIKHNDNYKELNTFIEKKYTF
jgi:hypothetical protein